MLFCYITTKQIKTVVILLFVWILVYLFIYLSSHGILQILEDPKSSHYIFFLVVMKLHKTAKLLTTCTFLGSWSGMQTYLVLPLHNSEDIDVSSDNWERNLLSVIFMGPDKKSGDRSLLKEKKVKKQKRIEKSATSKDTFAFLFSAGASSTLKKFKSILILSFCPHNLHVVLRLKISCVTQPQGKTMIVFNQLET